MINLDSEGTEIHRGIVIFEDVVEDPAGLIEMGKEDDRWKDANIASGEVDKVDLYARNTKNLILFPLVDYSPAWYFIAKALKSYGYRYAEMYRANFLSMEYPEMLYYPQGEGFFQDHVDSIPNVQRIFSAVLYLNTVDDGGETYFNDIDVKVKPVAGRLVMFPANYLYRHEALPPLSGEKFCVVTWYREDNG
jgi:hypothetical protein